VRLLSVKNWLIDIHSLIGLASAPWYTWLLLCQPLTAHCNDSPK
jgi:hypothetical protein